jgi:homoserine dehydrogenase
MIPGPLHAGHAMTTTMKIGLLGFGNVGRATVDVLAENAAEIRRRSAVALELVAVATRTPAKAAGVLPAGCRLSDTLADVLEDPAIDVVVELIGGVEAARAAVLRAIERGKHVVTANKALLAHHGDEIFARAQEAGVIVAFEAAVAVAIPIIKLLREAQAANRIDALAGIVNGTSNFVLTQMREHAIGYEAALADAQRRGYAEADPSFDVNGDDAAHKLTILAALAFGIPMDLAAVRMRGIAGLAQRELQLAGQLGYRVKLLATARRCDDGFDLRVEPALVPATHVMAGVDGALNAILVDANVAGTTLHCGAGAGGRPTASAVIADLLDIARLLHADPAHHVPQAAFRRAAIAPARRADPGGLQAAMYARMTARDETGVLAAISTLLAEHRVSIDLLRQEALADGLSEIVLVTHAGPQAAFETAIAQIGRLPALRGEIVALRVDPLF